MKTPVAFLALGMIPLSFLSIAACSTAAQPVPPAVGNGALCTADNLDKFRGQAATAEIAAQIRAESGATIFRWLPKGTIITMEYNAGRVNARLDEANRIEAVTCG